MELIKVSQITGKIEVITGLHIGSGKEGIEIGGLDQPIIKNRLTGAPFIPGSSIKGKMRSLLEVREFQGSSQKTAEYIRDGKPCGCGEAGCPSCTIFGCSNAKNKTDALGPTRLIIRDAFLTAPWEEKLRNGSLPMEIKYENSIHRVKGIAENPRPLERVPAGVEFTFDMSFKVFKDDAPSLLDTVFKGLRLIELDALGGCSSRGCGQVKFVKPTCDGKEIELDKIVI